MSSSDRRSAIGPAIVIALLAAIGAAAYLLFFAPAKDTSSPSMPPDATRPANTESIEGAPLPVVDEGQPTPDAPPPSAVIPTLEPAIDLPALHDSDTEIRPELASLLGENAMTRWLQQEQLIQRLTAQISGLQRGAFSYTALLLEPAPGEFLVDRQGGRIYLDPGNYDRYASIVAFIDGVDVAATAEVFHRYRPLFEDAYGELGLPPEQFGNAVLGAIDHLLATPEPVGRTELIAASVAYAFVDPELEGLSDARKQLLRMGPAHTATVKAKLRALRNALQNNALQSNALQRNALQSNSLESNALQNSSGPSATE